MWKYHDFSITQILREIKFGDARSAKYAIFMHLEALNFECCEFWHVLKAENGQMNNIQNPKNGKNCSFRTFRLSKNDFM